MWASWPSRAAPIPAPHGVNAAHLLGYVDRASATDVTGSDGAVTADETVGRDGLEAQYDGVLRGTHGTTSVAVDPRGVVVDRLATTAPVAGSRRRHAHLGAGPGRRRAVPVPSGRQLPAAAASPRTRRPPWFSTSPTAPSSRRRATRHTTPKVWTGGITQREPRRCCATLRPAPPGLAGHRSDVAAGLDVQGVSTTAAAAMGVDLDGSYDCTSTLQVGGPGLRQLRVARLRRPVAAAQRSRSRATRSATGSRTSPGSLRADSPRRTRLRTRSSRRPRPTGSASGPASTCPARWPGGSRPGVEALDVGGHEDSDLRAGRERLPGRRGHGPGPRRLPQALAVENCATPAGSTAPATRRTSPSARATSPSPAAARAGVCGGGQRRDALGPAGGGGDAEPGRVGRTPIPPVASGTVPLTPRSAGSSSERCRGS